MDLRNADTAGLQIALPLVIVPDPSDTGLIENATAPGIHIRSETSGVSIDSDDFLGLLPSTGRLGSNDSDVGTGS